MGPKLHRFFIWKKFSSAFLCNLWPLRKTGCTCFWIFVTNACIYIWRRTEIKFLYEIFIIHYNWGDEMTSLYTLHLQKPSYLSRILHLNGWFKGTTLWNYFEIIRKWFVIMQVLYCLISVAKSSVQLSHHMFISIYFLKKILLTMFLWWGIVFQTTRSFFFCIFMWIQRPYVNNCLGLNFMIEFFMQCHSKNDFTDFFVVK